MCLLFERIEMVQKLTKHQPSLLKLTNQEKTLPLRWVQFLGKYFPINIEIEIQLKSFMIVAFL